MSESPLKTQHPTPQELVWALQELPERQPHLLLFAYDPDPAREYNLLLVRRYADHWLFTLEDALGNVFVYKRQPDIDKLGKSLEGLLEDLRMFLMVHAWVLIGNEAEDARQRGFQPNSNGIMEIARLYLPKGGKAILLVQDWRHKDAADELGPFSAELEEQAGITLNIPAYNLGSFEEAVHAAARLGFEYVDTIYRQRVGALALELPTPVYEVREIRERS